MLQLPLCHALWEPETDAKVALGLFRYSACVSGAVDSIPLPIYRGTLSAFLPALEPTAQQADRLKEYMYLQLNLTFKVEASLQMRARDCRQAACSEVQQAYWKVRPSNCPCCTKWFHKLVPSSNGREFFPLYSSKLKQAEPLASIAAILELR